MKRILAVILALVLLGGGLFVLFSGPTPIEEEVRAQFWTLVELTQDGEAVAIPADAEATLAHGGGKRYLGAAGVNHYQVQLDIDRKGKLTFRDEGGGVTEMGGPEHLMDFEAIYLAAFFQVETAQVTGATLVLEGPKARLEYRGEPVPPREAHSDQEEPVSTDSNESTS